MKHALLLLALWMSAGAEASLVRESFTSIRALGMGNAFLSLSDDGSALWYNPAALARIKGGHFNLIDTSLKFDNTDTTRRISKAVFDGEWGNLVRRDLQAMGFSVRPGFVTKYFGISLFDNFQSFTDFRDLDSLAASVDIYSFNDIGVILGAGFPFSEFFAAGISLRVFQRTAIDTTIDTETLIDQIGVSALDFQSAIYDHLQSQMGIGWAVGANFGVLGKIPLFGKKGPVWTVSAAVENVGGVSFRKLRSGDKLPPTLPMTYHAGTAFKYLLSKTSELNLAFDLRHATDKFSALKKIHFGAELRTKVFDIRAGLNQLYPTFGFSLKFPAHTRLHFATYAVELGDSALNRAQRLYELQVVLGFNPF
jgi:hypothetical protein